MASGIGSAASSNRGSSGTNANSRVIDPVVSNVAGNGQPDWVQHVTGQPSWVQHVTGGSGGGTANSDPRGTGGTGTQNVTNPTLQGAASGTGSWKGTQVLPGVNYMGITDAQGTPISGGSGRAWNAGSGGGAASGAGGWRDSGTVSYISGGTHPFVTHNWQQVGADGKKVTFGIGGQSNSAERQAQEAGKVTGMGLTAEALGLQQNLEAFSNLAAQIRKLGIDDKLVRSATNNLMAMLDNSTSNDSWLKSAAFKSNVNFVQDQMTRRLSPYGYAPGEHSYGDNTIAQATGAMAQDWTKFWFDSNMSVVNAGNQLGSIGAQGQLQAAQDAVQFNPAGIFASGGVAEAVASIHPEQAWADWQRRNGDWMKKFNLPGV